MRMGWIAAGLLLGLLLAAPTAYAETGVPEWCEVAVDLKKNGRASIEYTVAYKHVSGTFNGFYFHGPQIDRLNPVWDDAWASATLTGGKQVRIRRGFRNGKKTIELADGGIRSGGVIFRFRFATDLARAGFLARTTDAQGKKLIVFNWSPSTWDAPLDHYTVWVRYPIDGPPNPRDSGFLDEIHYRTEPFMNERYLIDYKQSAAGTFEVQLHWDNVPKNASMRIQQYVAATLFDAQFRAAPIRPVRPGPGGSRAPFTPSVPTESRWILIVVGAVGLLVFFGLVRAKHGEARRARSSRDEVKWTAIDWVPPKLELSTFRKPGKVCTTLTPVEVAFFLEMPYK
ncbi:MAG: hypothetical protein QNJ98_14850, partial [Planctomycetota bacterium]|nr:hypothetical protein [Planctomycetota bacterium]